MVIQILFTTEERKINEEIRKEYGRDGAGLFAQLK